MSHDPNRVVSDDTHVSAGEAFRARPDFGPLADQPEQLDLDAPRQEPVLAAALVVTVLNVVAFALGVDEIQAAVIALDLAILVKLRGLVSPAGG